MNETDRYQRHSEFISDQEQKKLHQARILIAGCGVGSHVATHLARAGVATEGEIILADPGLVRLENLNRQDYYEEDIGENKALALANRISKINSNVVTKAVPEGITPENVASLVGRVDVICDFIDVREPYITYILHDQARRQYKPATTGLDLGEGMITYVFGYHIPSAMTLNRFLGFPKDISFEDIKSLPALALAAQFILGPVSQEFHNVQDTVNYYNKLIDTSRKTIYELLPQEMYTTASKLESGLLDYIPQIDSAASLHGTIQSVIVRELVLGHPILTAPNSVRINILEQVRGK